MAGVLLIGVGAAGFWAVSTVLTPAEDPLVATDFTLAEVRVGEVGASLALNTVAEWEAVLAGENRAVGVVTSVGVAAGDEVTHGAVLYAVDLRPTVIAQGEVPAFRAITAGSVGADVTQLQQMLSVGGFATFTADGTAGAGTVAAIKAWQKSLGTDQTGIVEPGDVIFVPVLPTRAALDTEIVLRGASLTGGEKVLRTLAVAPRFTVPVTDAQAALMPAGTRVEITSPSGTLWQASVTDQLRDEQSQAIIINLSAADGGSICAAACGEIAVTGRSQLPSRQITIEPVTGLVVPSAALATDATGGIAVIDEDGARHTVTLEASARGMSVITGVVEGFQVRVPAQRSGG